MPVVAVVGSLTRWVASETIHSAAVSTVPCRQAEPSSARQILTVAPRTAPMPAPASRERTSWSDSTCQLLSSGLTDQETWIVGAAPVGRPAAREHGTAPSQPEHADVCRTSREAMSGKANCQIVPTGDVRGGVPEKSQTASAPEWVTQLSEGKSRAITSTQRTAVRTPVRGRTSCQPRVARRSCPMPARDVPRAWPAATSTASNVMPGLAPN